MKQIYPFIKIYKIHQRSVRKIKIFYRQCFISLFIFKDIFMKNYFLILRPCVLLNLFHIFHAVTIQFFFVGNILIYPIYIQNIPPVKPALLFFFISCFTNRIPPYSKYQCSLFSYLHYFRKSHIIFFL